MPQEKSHLSQKIVKKDDIYQCLERNTEINHRNNINRHKKLCENRKTKLIFSCEICEKVRKKVLSVKIVLNRSKEPTIL